LHSSKDIELAPGGMKKFEGMKGAPRSEQLNITFNSVSRNDFWTFRYRVGMLYNEVSDEHNPRSTNHGDPQRRTRSTIFMSVAVDCYLELCLLRFAS
jgi:hypothetical protein